MEYSTNLWKSSRLRLGTGMSCGPTKCSVPSAINPFSAPDGESGQQTPYTSPLSKHGLYDIRNTEEKLEYGKSWLTADERRRNKNKQNLKGGRASEQSNSISVIACANNDQLRIEFAAKSCSDFYVLILESVKEKSTKVWKEERKKERKEDTVGGDCRF